MSSGWSLPITSWSARSSGKSVASTTPRSVSCGSAPPITLIAAAPYSVLGEHVVRVDTALLRLGHRRAGEVVLEPGHDAAGGDLAGLDRVLPRIIASV
jgi:hypothetical protein